MYAIPSTRPYRLVVLVIPALLFATLAHAQQPATSPSTAPTPEEHDYIARDFRFKSGETLAELRLHYMTLGQPAREPAGRVTNAVLLLHGTGGSSRQFLQPQFAGVLFGAGQLLDTNRYFIILPDNVGHGKSSKPSDGMRAHFPSYEYDDMVAAQHELLEKGLGVTHLRLILGTSMGCMHSWVWAETYPDFMDALMPLACLPVPIAGRNRIWRKMMMDGIRKDPGWKNGDYTSEPRAAIQVIVDFLLIAGSTPILLQSSYPTRDAADQYLDDYVASRSATQDANDMLYALNSSRNYDPSGQLGKITAPVMFVNSADDFINPPELGIAEQKIKEVKNGRFVLIPASSQTHGHGTHTWAAIWQPYLKELLERSQK